MFKPLNNGDADIAAAYGLIAHRAYNPTWALAMKGDDEANRWRDAARAEMQNFERHGVYIEISEDQLPSWNNHSKRAAKLVDMRWGLRKKKNEKADLLKYKAQAVVCGNQQKRKALAVEPEHTLETFAPAARSASTFKLLCAAGCTANIRVRQFDVEAAYIQGKFEGNDGGVFVRPPPNERFFDDREVPIVWKPLKPLYGEADAGRIWHCTAKKQRVETQGFTQSEFDPCYFFKKYADGHRVDLVLYVDDCGMAGTGSAQADDYLRIFCDRFKLTLQKTLKQFLGMNIDMRADGGVEISASAYIKAKAETYLP
eukprot:6193633-Pleurochrysis_carterae.AAC.1